MELYPILGSNNTVAQIDNPPYLSPRCSGSIIKDNGYKANRDAYAAGPVPCYIPTLPYIAASEPYYFPWVPLSLHGEFIRFARFHFYKAAHIPLHIVQTSLNAQRLANIGRFQHSLLFIQIIPRLQKVCCTTSRICSKCIRQSLANSFSLDGSRSSAQAASSMGYCRNAFFIQSI